MDQTFNATKLNYSQVNLTQSSFIDKLEQDNYTHKKRTSIYIYISFFLCFASISFLLAFLIKREIISSQSAYVSGLYKIAFYLANSISVWLIIIIIARYLKPSHLDTDSYFSIIYSKMKNRLIFTATLFIVSMIIRRTDTLLAPKQLLTSPGVTKSYYFESFMENIGKVIQAVAVSSFCFTLRLMLIEGSRYVLNSSNYYKRLIQNNHDMQLIFLINSVTGKKVIYKSEKWIRSVFLKLSPNGAPLTFESLKYFFSYEDSKKIINLLDLNKNNKVPEKQFKNVWQNVIKTKTELTNLFLKKDDITDKLGIILYFIIAGILSFYILFVFNSEHYLKNVMTISLSWILPLTFLLGSVPVEIFKSIIFIFFVHPFEVGDLVEFNDKKYKVQEIGILYSTFLYNSMSVIFPNVKLMDTHIINYRLSKFIEKVYKIKLNTTILKNKQQQFEEKVNALLLSNTYTFDKNFEIRNLQVQENTAEFELVVFINIHFFDYEESVSAFTLQLDEIIKSINNTNNITASKSIVQEI